LDELYCKKNKVVTEKVIIRELPPPRVWVGLMDILIIFRRMIREKDMLY